MNKWDFLKELQKKFNYDLTTKEDEAILTNRNIGKSIEVYEEKYYSSDMKEEFVQYIVCFTTQHCHFDDLDEVKDYVCEILTDNALPVEFYLDGNRRFGGEITKADFEKLSIELLADLFGVSTDYLSQFEYEIHSWSGKYDKERRKIGG